MNSGNMCFANAVLQLLVYCPPFWKLFTELGKVLPAAPEGQQQQQQQQGLGSGKVQEEGETPLVDATIRFLKEFGPVEQKEKEKERAKGNGYGYGGGKGKERREEPEEEEGDGLDSFMPTYIYEAMKEKKRFDNMRVSSPSPSLSSFELLLMGFGLRA